MALTMSGKARGKSIRVFPLSNWTELDIWQYIFSEGIEIVPLYLAARRPTVIRDRTLLMVDDERFRLAPGEKVVERSIRFRTLGCYPLSGAIESEATTLPAGHPGNGRREDLGATGTGDRQGWWLRQHGEEEAGRLLLMATLLKQVLPEEAAREQLERWIETTQGMSLLRFITCGSVDDGKSTLIGRLLYDSKLLLEDQLSALRATVKARHPRRGSTLRCLSTALRPSASKVSPSTSLTVSSQPPSASSSSPTRRVTSNIRGIW